MTFRSWMMELTRCHSPEDGDVELSNSSSTNPGTKECNGAAYHQGQIFTVHTLRRLMGTERREEMNRESLQVDG